MMNLVIITGANYEHKYITNLLCREFSIAAVIVDIGIKREKVAKVRSYLRRYSIGGLVNLVIRKIINIVIREKSCRRESLVRIFKEQNCLSFKQEKLLTYVKGINSEKSEKLIEELDPDVLVIYGTGIVKDHILNKAKKIALNMHTGLSPEYRGSACAFWPIYNQDFNNVGATVHKCISSVDAGVIYKKGSVSLDKTDDLHSVFAKCVVKGGRLYIDVIKKLLCNGSLDGKSQNLKIGREYRASMKTWRHEMKARKNLRKFYE